MRKWEVAYRVGVWFLLRTGQLLIWPLALCSPCRNAEGVAGDLSGGRLGLGLWGHPPGAPG